MSKSIWNMSANELIEYEFNGGEMGMTGDLETALANKLETACTYLGVCIKQLEEYSDNELVIDWAENKTLSLSELKQFIKPIWENSNDASQ